MYEISYTGMDGYERTKEFNTLEDLMSARVWIEERGGHSITLYDEDGEEL